MTAKLNHTIVHSRDSRAAAAFMSEILGLPEPKMFGPFLVVQAGNDVSLDFLDADGEPAMQYYAFQVTETEFDEIFARIGAKDLAYWADPGQRKLRELNTHNGGRGLYFEDPSGHLLEILTCP